MKTTAAAASVDDNDYGALAVRPAGGATLSTGQVSVGTAATQIIGANTNRYEVVITNPSTVTVYVGGSGVSTTTGHAIPAGGSITLKSTAAIYGVVATATQTVTYAESAR